MNFASTNVSAIETNDAYLYNFLFINHRFGRTVVYGIVEVTPPFLIEMINRFVRIKLRMDEVGVVAGIGGLVSSRTTFML